jgi:hypothetical protein
VLTSLTARCEVLHDLWSGALAYHASTRQCSGAHPTYFTPKHLADKILTARSALEGERKQGTVLFADTAGFTALKRWTALVKITWQGIAGMQSGTYSRCKQCVHW